jgi:hypothetical protein
MTPCRRVSVQLDRVHSSSEFVSQSSCLEQLRFSIETDIPRLSLRLEADDRDPSVAPHIREMATAGVLQIRQVAGISDEHALSIGPMSDIPSSPPVATKVGRRWARAPLTAAA